MEPSQLTIVAGSMEHAVPARGMALNVKDGRKGGPEHQARHHSQQAAAERHRGRIIKLQTHR